MQPAKAGLFKYIFLFLAVLLSSCATKRNSFRLLVGTKAEHYVETQAIPLDQKLAQTIGGNVVMVSGNPDQITTQALGFQIGLLREVSESYTTTLGFYSNTFTPVNYTFNTSLFGIITEKIAVAATGLDATWGINFIKDKFSLRPGLSCKIESQSINHTLSSNAPVNPAFEDYTQTIFVIGGGAAFEYAFRRKNRLVVQIDYRVPTRSIQGTSSLSYTSVQINWLLGDWQWKF